MNNSSAYWNSPGLKKWLKLEIGNLSRRLDIVVSNYGRGVNKTSYRVGIYFEQSFVGLLDLLKVTIIFSDVHKLIPAFRVLRMVTQLPGVGRGGRR